MNIRRLLPASLLGAALVAFPLAAPAHAASAELSCVGSVACTGQDPTASKCVSSEVLVEDQGVDFVGDIDLYESPVCGTAWAILTTSDCSNAKTCLNGQAAEIFYVPPQGGPEQYYAVSWDGQLGDAATTPMVPDSGSVKACGGNPQGSVGMLASAFDLNPQGQQNPKGNRITAITSQSTTAFPSGACTLWH
jgi:hypothetical protein